MKKIKLVLVLTVAIAGLLFTSCNPSAKGKVSLSLQPSDTLMTVEPGQTISWHYTISPDAVEKSTVGQLTVTEIRSGTSTVLETDVFNQETTVEGDFSYTVPNDVNDGEQIQIVFTATDGMSNNEVSFTVTLAVNAIIYGNVENVTFTYVSTSLDNQMMAVLSRDGISMAGGTSTSGQIAYVYVGGTTTIGNTLASPNADEIRQAYAANGKDYTTDDKQVTFFKRITQETTWDDVDANYIHSMTVDENNTDYIADSQNLGYGVSMLQPGDLVAFYNPTTGVKGVIKVNSYSNQNTKSATKGTFTLTADIKYLAYPNTSAK